MIASLTGGPLDGHWKELETAPEAILVCRSPKEKVAILVGYFSMKTWGDEVAMMEAPGVNFPVGYWYKRHKPTKDGFRYAWDPNRPKPKL